jgi:hypothetical protein
VARQTVEGIVSDVRRALDAAGQLLARSHHWQVMADVRASEGEVATIEVGGARMFFAMTSVGDGFFPVHVERDAAGTWPPCR